MTEKKEKILAAALALFARQGYDNIPTSQIAKESHVLEELVFKHFVHKEGLLVAHIAEGLGRVEKLVDIISGESNPRKVIALTIDLPVTLIKQECEFWALQFAIKYKSQQAALLKQRSKPLLELFNAVQNAVLQLSYQHLVKEAKVLMLLLEVEGA